MKMKLLATAVTVSMPLLFGGAYAQTTTSQDSGKNRSSDGATVNNNPNPTAGTPGGAGSAAGSTAPAGSSATGNTGDTSTGSSGASSTGSSGAATGASGSGTGGTGATSTMPGQGAAGTSTSTPGAAVPGGASTDAAASTEAITGWSAKDDIIGKTVRNENDEKIGDVNDIVISSDGRSMYLLIGAGGFLGMGEKDVAVPFDRFQRSEDRIMLSGYSKEQLKALPEVRTQR